MNSGIENEKKLHALIDLAKGIDKQIRMGKERGLSDDEIASILQAASRQITNK